MMQPWTGLVIPLVLAAAGLLYLFWGGSWDVGRLMDLLLVAEFLLILYLLRRILRPGRYEPAAGAGGEGPSAGSPEAGIDQPSIGGTEQLSSHLLPAGLMEDPGSSAGQDEYPVWFDGPGFLEDVRTHFIRFQAAWDEADLGAIRDYTLPRLFAGLERERQGIQDGRSTEIQRLTAKLIGVQREGDLVVAVVLFSGAVREEGRDRAESFRLVWRVQHPWGNPQGDWCISGLRQERALSQAEMDAARRDLPPSGARPML